ncbi:hypothetical protein FRC14_004103 [Serendipita sp. 396]|nr:hypothetical protein FRC14_004103 [Serendipita sp. 396]KAG8782167.1 hypothetical protein FRC15_007417 [Serendipita sp. 397]KAG8866822.1 hypothetical protein FRC20_007414 [Serendipita sp. 405]
MRSFSLNHFLRKAKGIQSDFDTTNSLQEEEALGRWIEFGVAGINAQSGYRASLDLEENKIGGVWLTEQAHALKQRYDFDSIMGSSDNLPYQVDVEIFPLYGKGFELRKSIHIDPVHIETDDGDILNANIQHIPHLVIGQASQLRSTIRLMLPALVTRPMNLSWKVPEIVRAELYDFCLYPAAIRAIHPVEAGHWLPSYKAEMKRARKPNGQLQKSGRIIPQDKLSQFSRYFIKKIHQHTWGDGAFFFHELRGVRGGTQHPKGKHQQKLKEFLSTFNFHGINKSKWWIDWGLEVHCPGFVMWWRKDAHHHIIKELLGISSETANSLINHQESYFYDEASQLAEVGGFHLKVPPRHRQRTGIAYIQAYNTEKEAAYQLSGSTNTFSAQYSNTLMTPGFKIEDYSQKIAEIWTQCSQKSDGNARLEIRVNLAKLAQRSHLQVEKEVMNLLFQFPRKTWWNFKLLRLMSMTQAIRWYRESKEDKANPLAIALVIVLTYMINALTARPKAFQAEKYMVQCALQDILQNEYEEDGDGIEHLISSSNPLGVFFPSSCIAAPSCTLVPRFGAGMELPSIVYHLLFDRTLLGIQLTVQMEGIQPTRALSKKVLHITNQVKRKERRLCRAIEEEENIQVLQIAAPFSESNPEQVSDNAPSDQDMLGREVTEVLARSYSDILLCSPNTKGQSGISYCKLNQKQREQAGPSIFREPNLAKVWSRCIVKDGRDDISAWAGAFESLFPSSFREKPGSGWQNYDNCPYFKRWQTLIGGLSEEDALKLQDLIRIKWNTLLWMPWPRSDRIWLVSNLKSKKITKRASCSVYPSGYEGVAPVILTNPNWQGPEVHFQEE